MDARTVRAEVRTGYVAVLFSGVVTQDSIDAFNEAHPDAMADMLRQGRVLLEFSAVESFGLDPRMLGDSMRRLAPQGLRLAISSAKPEFFGVGRQIAQFSGVEGDSIAVFHTEAEAVQWLLG